MEKEATILSVLEKYPQVFLIRAYTKIYGIPGVRLGYGFCTDSVFLEKIRKHLPEWNISIFAQYAGVAALMDDNYVRNTVQEVEKERAYLVAGLEKLGIQVFPAEADFLLFYSEKEWYDSLLLQGILIRDCKDYKGLCKGYYRIAVKTHEENQLLLECMKALLKEG